MRRAVGLGLLMTLAWPLVLVGQGVPAAEDPRIGVIETNTMLAGAAGGITSMLYMSLRYGVGHLELEPEAV
jgi:hypothetical protein